MSNVLQEGMVVGHLIQTLLPQILPQDPDQQCLHPLQQFLQVSIVIRLQSKERFLSVFFLREQRVKQRLGLNSLTLAEG